MSALIHDHMDALTDAERRVARELLTDYPAAGLGTSHSLAKAAGVSAPTVVRFAASVGFGGFTDMQHHLRAEISQSGSSPVLRALAHGSAHRHHEPAANAMRRRMDAIEATLRLIPSSEIDAATELIAHCPARVLVTCIVFNSVGRLTRFGSANPSSPIGFFGAGPSSGPSSANSGYSASRADL